MGCRGDEILDRIKAIEEKFNAQMEEQDNQRNELITEVQGRQ